MIEEVLDGSCFWVIILWNEANQARPHIANTCSLYQHWTIFIALEDTLLTRAAENSNDFARTTTIIRYWYHIAEVALIGLAHMFEDLN